MIFLCAGLEAQVRFEVRDENGAAGQKILTGLNQTINPRVVIVNPAGSGISIQGLEMAITHDPTYLTVVGTGITWRGTDLQSSSLHASQGPDFFSFKEVKEGAPAVSKGISLGIVFDLQALPTFFLGSGEWKVAVLSYKAVKSTAGGATRLDFPDVLGARPANEPVKNKYTDQDIKTFEVPAARRAGIDVLIGGELAYMIAFDKPSITIPTGTEITVPFLLYNSPKPVDGFSFGVKHDAAALDLLEVKVADDVVTVLGGQPDANFLSIDKAPQAGGPGFTVALAMKPSGQDHLVGFDPLTSPHTVIQAKYKVKLTTGKSQLDIVGTIGKPVVALILDIDGTAQTPLKPATDPPPTSLEVNIQGQGGAPFIRGDVNQSGRIDITDAISLLKYLNDFTGIDPTSPLKATIDNCRAAFNVNGDTTFNGVEAEEDVTNIDITDVVSLLSYMFLKGTPPADPFASNGRACEPFSGKMTDLMKCSSFACPP